ncbi:hypothetical protein GJ633_03165 [Halorubrum sp. CBA1125]|uniref:hypothetical protein n=1 Tax=Halorubrum sp. CBA1125 TaxID=2668072 RepID=UPI0012E92683|nr:hypothetical protein [Halorubrum sp. CBA1125]MUW13770.1 hypothetical protein [Halorubrum sp. CBA1125]
MKRTISPKNHPEQTKNENGYENLTRILDRDDHKKPNDEAFKATKQLYNIPDVRT